MLEVEVEVEVILMLLLFLNISLIAFKAKLNCFPADSNLWLLSL